MSISLRHYLRLFGRYAAYMGAFALVGVALLAGTLSQVLPLAERHPGQIASWLSQRAGQPIQFDRLGTQWTRRGPLLRLQGLRIGPRGEVRIGEAEILVAMYSGFLPGRSLTELRLRGLSLTLQRSDTGIWSVQGLPSTGGGDPLEALRQLGELQVIAGRLRVQAPSLGLQASLPRIDLRLRVNGSRLQAGVRGWIDPAHAPLTAVLEMDREHGDGRAFVEANPADLGIWSSLLQYAGIQVRSGHGRLRTWAELRGYRVAAVTVDADLRRLRVAGVPWEAQSVRPTLAWEQLRALARWRTIEGGWRLDAPMLRMGGQNRPQRLDGLRLAGGRQFAVAGEALDVSALIDMLTLSDRIAPGLRRWLSQAKPQLRLADVRVCGVSGGPIYVQGHLSELAFQPVGQSPGLSGLQGRFEGDAEGLELEAVPQATLRFDWPAGFGVVHAVQLAGKIVAWRDGAGWQVATPALRIQAPDYAADVRGGIWFQNDGTHPRLSIAAQFDPAALPVARKFWVHSKMPKAVIDWLDMALAGGQISGGVGLVSGDLDDWPFDNNNGRFEVTGQVHGGVVKFQPDWPAMEQVDAGVTFIGKGFSLQGRGDLAGVAVEHLEAGITDFFRAELSVRANGDSDAARMLAMLRRSPLQRRYGETLKNVSASGPATVTFDLLLPLKDRNAAGHLRGDIGLRGVALEDRRWDLAFEQVNGQVHYSDQGFLAEGLAVSHQGHPATLSLRAGNAVQDPMQAFQARFTGTLQVADLFARAPQMRWLRPYVHGSSPWQVDVDVPLSQPGQGGQFPQLTLRSDLIGTTLDLPAPLDKPAMQPLSTRVEMRLPIDSGDIDVAFGKLVAVKAASRDGQTGVRVVMGSDAVHDPPPSSGLVVTGRTASLDAIDWIRLARGSGAAASATTSGSSVAAPEENLPLQQVDVQADRLLLIGGVFPQTRLRLQPGRDAVAVTLEGPSLTGTLTAPNAEGAMVRGNLKIVHWQPAVPAASRSDALADALPEQARQAVADVDPASIPPLALDIDDLRIGQMAFGAALLRSSRLRDGLQVDQLQLRSGDQHIALTGAWRGIGDAARTRLSARVDSRDLGRLLQTFALGGQLRGGEGQVELNAGWQGAPTAFQLGSLEGNLKIAVRNGQLLELEPGAGRVLGLLSVAQLPRRLMLDFRDFFSKGLAFNRLDGAVRFGDGLAQTDDLHIQGPAVEIAVRGQADLRQRTFDQILEVSPKSGNLLTVVGAVAGGPVGAVVGAAANAVLSKPLGEIGAKTYHVSGPWKDPRVEVIEHGMHAPFWPVVSPLLSPGR